MRYSWFASVLLATIFAGSFAQLSEDEEAEILRAHNLYRGQVDPISTNMEELVWDEELAYMAQFWAGSCEYALNENRHTQSSTYSYVGQSLAAGSGYVQNYTIMIRRWFDLGRINYNYYSRTCTDEDGNEVEEDGDEDEQGPCSAYTQMVWAKTYAVGCGALRCQELRGAEDYNENAVFMVCNYGPGGNVYYGEAPYETGTEVCSQCPSDKPYCKSNLCSASGAVPGVQISISAIFLLGLASLPLW